jgi:hypothetical protein
MSIFKLKTALMGLSSVLAVTTSLFSADAIFDADFDNNENEFENYWYYYDDNTGISATDRHQSKVPGIASQILVPSTDSIRHAFDDPADTATIKVFTFVPGSDGDNKCASIPFIFGTPWKTTYKTSPYVAIGAMLAPEGKSLDLSGATAVKFRIRSRTGSITTVVFKIQTKEIDDYSMVPKDEIPSDGFGYFETTVAVSDKWEERTVLISELSQPGWVVNTVDEFNLKICTKFAWEIKLESNDGAESDTVDIDDVSIVDYTYNSPALWTQTASMDLPSSGKFATFDDAPFNSTPLKTFWYAYNDKTAGSTGGNSEVTKGATLNEATGRLLLDITENTGNVGQGALLEYTLGKSITQGINTIQGFIGIGCNVYDSLNHKYWDATSGNGSIYFQYATFGNLKKVTLEISDINDVGDAQNPDRKDLRGTGVVMYRDLPATDEKFVAVEIPLDSLVYHMGWKGTKDIPLDMTKLAKLQWKCQGAEGLGGKIVIDNIYFPGITEFKTHEVSVKQLIKQSKTSPFQASYLNGKISISLKNGLSLKSGKISLVNTKGAVVSSVSITSSNTSFSTKTLPAGMYFVKAHGIDANGKAVSMQSPVSIVK